MIILKVQLQLYLHNNGIYQGNIFPVVLTSISQNRLMSNILKYDQTLIIHSKNRPAAFLISD